MSHNNGSLLSNYSRVYSAWDTAEEQKCPDCKGTGLDKDEWFDCETCAGEGYLVPFDAALDP